MKSTILILAMTLVPFLSQAQAEPFGKVSQADLELKKCPTDPDAEAEVIFESQEVELLIYGGNIELVIKRHDRIKIYNEKGLDEANIKLRYLMRNGAEVITKLEGATYNLGAGGTIETSKLDKQSVYDKKQDNRYGVQTFTMPGVKPGSVFEYRYVIRRHFYRMDDWAFQRSIPTRMSYCSFNYPEAFMFTPLFETTLPYFVEKKKEGAREMLVMHMKNVPALREEPFISSVDDYLQKVSFRINGYNDGVNSIDMASTWPRIVREIMEDEDFGIQLKRNIPRTSELDAVLQGLTNPVDRMKAVHHYVRSQMTWDGNYSIWALDGVRQAWSKKKGNSGEINLILVNLLKDAGLKAFPILLSTRDNGRINTAKPSYGQFNTVMAYVRIDDQSFVIDATDAFTPIHLIPASVQYTEGLVISTIDVTKSLSDQDWGWVFLWDDKHKFLRRVNISGQVDASGKVQGEAYITNSDYARASGLRDWKDGQEKFIESHYTQSVKDMAVQDFSAVNIDKDSLPFQQQFKFNYPLGNSGDYQFFTLNLFSGLEKNDFLADDRSSDIFFGVKQSIAIGGVFTIPQGYVFEELPKNTRMIMPDTSISFSRVMQAEGNKIQFRISVDVIKPVFSIEEYPQFREFYRKMYMMLNEQIIVKKAGPKP